MNINTFNLHKQDPKFNYYGSTHKESNTEQLSHWPNFTGNNGSIEIYTYCSIISNSMFLGDDMSWFFLMSANLSLLFQPNYIWYLVLILQVSQFG